MLKITKEIIYFQAGCTIFDKLLGYVFGLGQLTVITIAILGGVIIFSIITFIIVYHICKKKHNRVNDIQEAGPATSRNTHNSRKVQKGKRTVTVVAPAPHTSEASKSTRKQTSGKKSKKRSDEEDDPFW